MKPFMRMLWFALGAAVLTSSCAHHALAGSELDKVRRPAFISRIDIEAGPQTRVFQEDGSYRAKLKRLEPREGDRRLKAKLQKGMTRFELSEGLRARTLALLPQEQPWTATVDQARVYSLLESFLVEEVPANPPDYDLLTRLGADVVVEFVIERYGMRSSGGRAGVFIEGYGRMFWIDGRREIWRRAFRSDQVDAGSPHVDPFRVAKEPTLFRTEMGTLLDAVATQFAKDLTPSDRRLQPPGADAPPASRDGEGETPAAAPEDTELPEPDPI